MTIKIARNVFAGFLLLAAPATLRAQAPGLLSRAIHDCTFTTPCNWSSHAILAFGATYALNKAGVPRAASAGTAVLFFVGKEVRDHLKWGVLGSADSNGDLAAGVIGAVVAYHVLRHSTIEIPEGSFALEIRERTWLTVRLPAL
jgi:hypothetical protein